MTDDSRSAGDPRADDAPHSAVPVTADDLDGSAAVDEPDGAGERGVARPLGASSVEGNRHGDAGPEYLRDETADPAFRHDGSEHAAEQPDFLRDEDRVAQAPAVPVPTEGTGMNGQFSGDDADPAGVDRNGDGSYDDDAGEPVATPANWPLPTAEPAWPTDPDVVTASDLDSAETVPAPNRGDDRSADTSRDSLDDLAEAEGPYVPGSYSAGADRDTDRIDTDRIDTDRIDTDGDDTVRYERPAAGTSSSAAPLAAAGAVGAAPAPAQKPVYLQAPVPPKKKGNRGTGIGIALIATLLFAVLYALGVGLLLSVRTADAFGEPLLSYLATPMYWLPVLVFLVAFALLVLLIHRADWWAFVLGGIPVAILVYGSYLLARVIQQNIFEITPNEAVDVVERSSTFPDGILAGLLARELVIWAGAGISARARRVRARNAEARAEYEQKLAETPGFGPAS